MKLKSGRIFTDLNHTGIAATNIETHTWGVSYEVEKEGTRLIPWDRVYLISCDTAAVEVLGKVVRYE